MDQSAIPTWGLAGTHFQIAQDAVTGRPSYTVTDGLNFICVAKQAISTLKARIDIYSDAEATQLVCVLQQVDLIALSMGYDIFLADGRFIGRLMYQSLQSVGQEHWDIQDATGVLVARIQQDASTATTGATMTTIGRLLNKFIGSGTYAKVDGGLGALVPQSFTATVNTRAVCYYKETVNFGTFFKMNVDFPAENAGMIDPTLAVIAGLLIATRHSETD